MSKERTGSSFFPVNGEASWSYTSGYEGSFEARFPQTAQKVHNNLGNMLAGIYNNVRGNASGNNAMNALKDMIQQARKSEQAYLAKYDIVLTDGDDWGELIKAINSILNQEEAFKDAINKLTIVAEKEAQGKYGEYRTIYSSFDTYLKKAAQEVIPLNLNKTPQALAPIILRTTIELMKNASATNKKEDENNKPWLTLFNTIKVAKNQKFFKKMNQLLRLEEYVQNWINYYSQPNSAMDEPEILVKHVKGYKGTILEYIEEAYGKAIENPGSLNYKPDNIIAELEYGSKYKSLKQAEKKASKNFQKTDLKRERGFKTAQAWFDMLANAKGHLVIISDKNYVINKMFRLGKENSQYAGGFTAQQDIKLKNFQSFLETIQAKTLNVDNLINYLANLGDEMIAHQGNIGQLERAIATQVGYFLFDDLTITSPVDLNVVHLFNLSGVYVPLSVLLDAVLFSLYQNIDTLRDTVTITFNFDDSKPGNWSDVAFENFRKAKLNNTTFSIDFLRNFAQFIADNVKI